MDHRHTYLFLDYMAGRGRGGEWIDHVIMRMIEVLYGLPYLLVVILLMVVMEPGMLTIIMGNADEPTTALDVTIQAQIIDLLKRLQREQGLSVLIITHDLGMVAEVAHRMVVMYAGKVVETGRVQGVFARPRHPYTWGLMRSIPRLDDGENQSLVPIEGTPPDLFHPPEGCPFAARCPFAMEICAREMPEPAAFGEGQAACWLHDPRAPRNEELVAAGRQGE